MGHEPHVRPCPPSCVPLLRQLARLLPDPSVSSGRLQFRLGVGAGRAPDGDAAALHDGTGAGSRRADVCGGPVALEQSIQPATQRRPREAGVGLGLLHRAQAHREPQHRVQAVETLLHVGVSGWTAVQPQGIIWGGGGGDGESERVKFTLKTRRAFHTTQFFAQLSCLWITW